MQRQHGRTAKILALMIGALTLGGTDAASAAMVKGYNCKIILHPADRTKRFEVLNKKLWEHYKQENRAPFGVGLKWSPGYNVPGITDTFTGKVVNTMPQAQQLCDQMKNVLLKKSVNAKATAVATPRMLKSN